MSFFGDPAISEFLICGRLGMPAPAARKTGGPLWKEENVRHRGRLARRVRHWLLIYQQWVGILSARVPFSEPSPITDPITMIVLRALQGIGGAAIIPAAVRLLSRFGDHRIGLAHPFSGNP